MKKTVYRPVAACGAALLVLALGAGCGTAHMPGTHAETPTTPSQRALTRIQAQEKAQIQRVSDFDIAAFGVSASSAAACDPVCTSLGRICEISERICAIAVRYPSEAAAAACVRARDRCGDATDRLPPACECGGSG